MTDVENDEVTKEEEEYFDPFYTYQRLINPVLVSDDMCKFCSQCGTANKVLSYFIASANNINGIAKPFKCWYYCTSIVCQNNTDVNRNKWLTAHLAKYA